MIYVKCFVVLYYSPYNGKHRHRVIKFCEKGWLNIYTVLRLKINISLREHFSYCILLYLLLDSTEARTFQVLFWLTRSKVPQDLPVEVCYPLIYAWCPLPVNSVYGTDPHWVALIPRHRENELLQPDQSLGYLRLNLYVVMMYGVVSSFPSSALLLGYIIII